MYSQIIKDFINRESLPQSYLVDAEKYFMPLVNLIINKTNQSETAPIVGISGAQGTGKTSLSELLEKILKTKDLNVVKFSIDDFYLTKMERQNLAIKVHPLLQTRGIPGTHDTVLLSEKLDQLAKPDNNKIIQVPRFNKASDDRYSEKEWQIIQPPADLIIIEGWFVGAPPLDLNSLEEPVNELEAAEDIDGEWRNFMTKQLEENYQSIFNQIELLIFLKAPSFEQIFEWRNLQEKKLRKRVGHSQNLMSQPQLTRFIQHYERLTRHCLRNLPKKADVVFDLNEKHQIISCLGLD